MTETWRHLFICLFALLMSFVGFSYAICLFVYLFICSTDVICEICGICLFTYPSMYSMQYAQYHTYLPCTLCSTPNIIHTCPCSTPNVIHTCFLSECPTPPPSPPPHSHHHHHINHHPPGSRSRSGSTRMFDRANGQSDCGVQPRGALFGCE